MPKLAIFSDLHAEFGEPWYPEFPPDVIVLNAGDTMPWFGLDKEDTARLLGIDSKRYVHVLGNHDFYRSAFPEDPLFGTSLSEVDGVKIAGATLWTDFPREDWSRFLQYMNDPNHIHNMSWESMQASFVAQKDFLFSSEADIWVTHHLPVTQSIAAEYASSPGNIFFASDLKEGILSLPKPPRLIVHGHTHVPCDYMLSEKTRVLCHPRGYPRETWRQGAYKFKEVDFTK